MTRDARLPADPAGPRAAGTRCSADARRDEAALAAARILAARETRWHRRLALAKRTGKTVICIGLVMPGADKDPSGAPEAFAELLGALLRLLSERGMTCTERDIWTSADGRHALLAVDADARSAKAACVALEEHHPLGRLADADVTGADGRAVGRTELGLPPRRCLLCGRPAAECARARSHPLEEVLGCVRSILQGVRAVAEDLPRS
jgi:holo-ACP synthase